MGCLTPEQKARIVRLQSRGKGPSEIVKLLAEDDVKISRWSVIKFLKRYRERQSLENAPRTGRPSEGVTIEVMNFIDAEMERNDEMTSPLLARKIYEKFGLNFSIQKVKRLQKKLGWVMTSTKYCQLIREANQVKRLEFSEQCLRENEQFDNVIFTDECSVMKWEQPQVNGRPKHPVKVHIWAGISKRGPTRLMIFEGIMDAEFYVTEILTNGLLPFV